MSTVKCLLKIVLACFLLICCAQVQRGLLIAVNTDGIHLAQADGTDGEEADGEETDSEDTDVEGSESDSDDNSILDDLRDWANDKFGTRTPTSVTSVRG